MVLDNPKVDTSNIMKAYHDSHNEENQLSLRVLLDVFHAKSRVVKELNFHHPDYKAA